MTLPPEGAASTYGVSPVSSIPGTAAKVRLPVVPTTYPHFFRSPSYRWWRSVLVIVVCLVLVAVAAIVVTGPVVVYEMVTGERSTTSTPGTFTVTPLLFAANNVAVALVIPASILATLICLRTRPGWLASVTGRMRWNLLLRFVGVCLVPYAVLTTIQLFQALPELHWRSSSLFLIATILLTTPFQAAGEEYGVRGVLNRAVAAWIPHRVAGAIVGGLVSAVVFMAIHGAGDPWLNLFYFTFGVVAARLVYVTGGLEAPIALHVVNNMAAEIPLPFMDISGLFNREAGTASIAMVAPQVLVVLLSWGLMEVVARRSRVVSETAPAAPYEAAPAQ